LEELMDSGALLGWTRRRCTGERVHVEHPPRQLDYRLGPGQARPRIDVLHLEVHGGRSWR
jgi:hypothetical protein